MPFTLSKEVSSIYIYTVKGQNVIMFDDDDHNLMFRLLITNPRKRQQPSDEDQDRSHLAILHLEGGDGDGHSIGT